jgi:hypothetical protein
MNTVTISRGGVVVISDQIVIINGITPVALSWSSAYSSYYIYNSTASAIPLVMGYMYFDSSGNLQTSIPPLTHIQIELYTDNTWHTIVNNTNVITTPTGPLVLPIATSSTLGVIKGGNNVEIDPDGTINAINGGQVQSDWAESDNTQPDFIKNKPAFLQEQSDWNESDNSQPDYIKNKPSIPSPYTLPTASSSVLGGVKIGSGLSISGSGVLSAPGSGITALTGDVSAGPGSGTQAATLATIVSAGTSGDSTHVPQITIDAKGRVTAVTPVAISGVSPTCMPKASEVGILANGTDQTSALNTALSNSNYTGIVFDYSAAAAVTINGSINAGGKTLKFVNGNTITGTYTIVNFILDCGLRQKCFDIGTSGTPVGIINPIGTTLSVVSPWVFGAADTGVDCSRAFQCTIDMCIRNGPKISKIIVPTGTYVCGNPLIEQNWNGSSYSFHQISIEGESNFAAASGFGTIINFSSRKNSFGIGIQSGKGSSIKNIKMIGGFAAPTYASSYAFYNATLASFTDGVSRDTTYSPNAAIVVDPFGMTVPSDGGYPGNDAYGNSLSVYYRAASTAGSTGVSLEDVFMTNWVIGFITSPNGQTQNAELISAWKIQFANMKICIAGCQAQEKLNVFRHIENWGNCYYTFATGLYGAQSPGSWWVEDINLAGFNNSFVFNSQQAYFPSYFGNIYAESLGRFGVLVSNNGTTVVNSTINFVDYSEGQSYVSDQISGQGYVFIGCQLRMYGTHFPVTINAINGAIFFRDCGFEVPPLYNQDYPYVLCAFSNCNVGNAGWIMNPIDMQSVSGSIPAGFTQTFAYGNIKIRIGTPTALTRTYNIKNPVPSIRMPINRNVVNYVVTKTLVGSFYQSVITCSSDELNRVFVNDVICADAAGGGSGLKVVGIVTAVGSGNFTINYVSDWVVSGNSYYLYVWQQLKNISFVGDVSATSNQITNVTIVDGSLTNFPSTGGLMITKTFKPTSDSWNYHMIRITAWNAGTSTITVDKTSTVNATKLLFTNTDSELDPGTPNIIPNSAAGSGAIASITKGTDKNMQVSITTGTGPSTGVLATVSFSYPFAAGYIPSVKFSPANTNAAAINGATQVFMDAANPSSFTINTGSSALGASTNYLWNIESN